MVTQDDLNKAAGAAIKAARLAKGLSQESVASGISADQSQYSKAERMGPGPVGWLKFCRIAEFLGCAVEVHLVPLDGSDKSSRDG